MPSAAKILAYAHKSLAQRGLFGTLKHSVVAAYRRIVPRRVPPHPFDVEHGTDTAGFLVPFELGATHPNEKHITAYWGTQPSFFREQIAQWQTTLGARRLEEYSFTDIGCGKGRVLMMASQYPFRSVSGIDLSPKMLAIAERNIAHWRARYPQSTPMEARLEDALAYTLPEGPVLLFLFHPFGAEVARPFVAKLVALAATRHAPMDVLYANPELGAIWYEAPGVETLYIGSSQYTDAEARSDVFWGKGQGSALFRIAGRA